MYCYYFLDTYIVKHVLMLLSPRYDAGDHLGVYPVNDPDLVNAIGQRLGADLDEVFTLTNVDGKFPFFFFLGFSLIWGRRNSFGFVSSTLSCPPLTPHFPYLFYKSLST